MNVVSKYAIKNAIKDVVADETKPSAEIKVAETMDVIAVTKESAAEIKVIDKALEEVENASETGHDDATEASIS
jgi:hypothetical protein